MPNGYTPDNAFKDGHKKKGGREKGVPNKTTRLLREAFIMAMEQIGEPREQKYLATVKDVEGKPVKNKDGSIRKRVETRIVYDGFDGWWATCAGQPSITRSPLWQAQTRPCPSRSMRRAVSHASFAQWLRYALRSESWACLWMPDCWNRHATQW